MVVNIPVSERVGVHVLAAVEREGARTGWRPRFEDPELEASYQAEHRQRSHPQNRIAILLLTILFDSFIWSEMNLCPEVLPVSVVLRLLVLTPGIALFLLLDWRGRLTCRHGWLFPMLLILPTLLAGIEAHFITSPAAIINFQAISLIQLVVLAASLSVRQTFVVLASSCLIYGWFTLTVPFIPGKCIPALLLSDLCIAIGLMIIAVRFDLRERQVFLFGLEAHFQRAALAEQNRQLARISLIDGLTGLSNRRHFDEALAALWANPSERHKQVTLILFDVDHFKSYNDTLGHPAGDECLRAVAGVASRCVRGHDDILARYGGEEFALVLPGTSLDAGCAVAERVRRSLVDRAIPHPTAPPPGIVTVSLGVAMLTPTAGNVSDLIEAADRCLYVAKRNGRNRIVRDDGSAQARPEPHLPAIRVATPLAPAFSSSLRSSG